MSMMGQMLNSEETQTEQNQKSNLKEYIKPFDKSYQPNPIETVVKIKNILSTFPKKEQILKKMYQKVESELHKENQAENEIFNLVSEVKKKKKKDRSYRTTLNLLHDQFYQHITQTNNNKDNKEKDVLIHSKKKIMEKVIDFTNNLVVDDLIKYVSYKYLALKK